MKRRCSQGVKIEMCNLGLPRGEKIICTQKRDGYLWEKFGVEMFPAGKPNDPYGDCDNSQLYGMTRNRLNAWSKKALHYMKKLEA